MYYIFVLNNRFLATLDSTECLDTFLSYSKDIPYKVANKPSSILMIFGKKISRPATSIAFVKPCMYVIL